MAAPGPQPAAGRGPGTHVLSGTLIGFDFGARRIGLAVGETATAIASPLGVIDAVANEARFSAIDKLVGEWKPAGFVVGLPRHSDGGEHAVAKLAGKFARRLAARYALPVALVDEAFTSANAEASLRSERTRAPRAGDVDAYAAMLILQSYLDDPAAHGQHAA
jgi:putative pre-16S rRNA nuclease